MTDLPDTEETLKSFADHLVEGIQIIGFDWTYRYVNESAARQGERTRDELVGRPMVVCYPGIDQTPLFTVLRRVMDSRVRETMTNEFVGPSGQHRWFELIVEPVPEGICVLSLDITDRRTLEMQFQQAQTQARALAWTHRQAWSRRNRSGRRRQSRRHRARAAHPHQTRLHRPCHA